MSGDAVIFIVQLQWWEKSVSSGKRAVIGDNPGCLEFVRECDVVIEWDTHNEL